MTIHGSNEGIESNHVGPSGIPVGPPGVDPFQLLFGQNGAQSAHARPAQGPRNLFLKGAAPTHQPLAETKVFKPPFETPDFSSDFSEKISKIVRP